MRAVGYSRKKRGKKNGFSKDIKEEE